MAFIWRISPTNTTGRIFLKHVNYALDTYRQTFDKFLLAGDFNIEETDSIMSEFLFKNDSKNLVQQKTVLKPPIILVVLIFLSPIVPEVSKIQ